MPSPVLLIIINDAGFFLSHRLPIAIAARDNGFEVHIATSDSDKVSNIKELGFIHHSLTLSRSGANIAKEVRTLWAIWRLFRSFKPDLVHLVTIKPVLYGGLLARLAGVPALVSAISGLGHVFADNPTGFRKLWRAISKRVYRLALSHSNQHIIFQNRDDQRLLDKYKAENTTLIPGSGVDLAKYKAIEAPLEPPIVVMAARLIAAKGVQEFVEAARILKEGNSSVRFQLIGEPDPGNPESISMEQLDSWTSEGVVETLGYRTDIAELFSKAVIVVLPSYYREGLPKVLIEAAACGRSVITTDEPGCRDAIIAGKTGVLIPARNSTALANAIRDLLSNPEKRDLMGKAGRELAEAKYSIDEVVDKHLQIYNELIGT